jgi:hypothetical protein
MTRLIPRQRDSGDRSEASPKGTGSFPEKHGEPIGGGLEIIFCGLHGLEDSLPYGSCAPSGDGALRRAGGAV